MEKITKNKYKSDAFTHSYQKKNFVFFKSPLKYFGFTIEVNGKNWYIGLYHAQSSLVWNSQFQARLKYGKYVKLKYLD